MNRVVLIGRLTKDPELSFIPGSGKAVVKFVLAVDRRFSTSGQKEADFIPIVVWGKQAEATANYVSKGKLIGVSGRIQTRSYEAKDGTRRYVTEVIADEVQFLERADGPQEINNNNPINYENEITPIDDGDIPF
ncbi:single-stranded DNA-binding protein [Clostridium brassicae]|uniref:Single-stranded DNA-binding protein n=1 Tax=Clostridium brassicae TaxID=2999072 RepID=A0ABT4D6Y4_9CLOT|nr:single-stranded DNA-binding protein [Clostridium brassicae]MCY6957938.1 single-stranded DNA-binding protein [Clostridium brassicae]